MFTFDGAFSLFERGTGVGRLPHEVGLAGAFGHEFRLSLLHLEVQALGNLTVKVIFLEGMDSIKEKHYIVDWIIKPSKIKHVNY